jgi:2-succinyl-5-enolpyruvyl-6-hydroxy-3-cyclohexene-1-carboxylate synthase
LFVIGPQDDPDLPDAVTRLAGQLGYPIVADALSGVRCGPHDRYMVIDAYDAFLRDAATVRELDSADLIVRIGAIPTSKQLNQYLEAATSARQVVVDPGGWREPTNRATGIIHADPRLLCESLANELPATTGVEHDWPRTWQRLNALARAAIEEHLSDTAELFEGKVFAELSRLLPQAALLYAGSSMPVRDLDTFLPQSPARLRCLANRGANGIDGVVSSALGASAADVGPVVLVIGDISFYHDMNGLLAARKHGLDLLIVLLNNDGGGIFSFLPQATECPEHFEQLFGTPHGLDFRPFVEAYGGRFVRVDGWPGFSSSVIDAMERGGLSVVEVPTDRARNVLQHRAVWRAVAEALSPQHAFA